MTLLCTTDLKTNDINSQWNRGWTEEYYRHLDHLATGDVSHIATRPERSRCHNMLVLTLQDGKSSGKVSGRDDLKNCSPITCYSRTLRNLHIAKSKRETRILVVEKAAFRTCGIVGIIEKLMRRDAVWNLATLPLNVGVLGLRSAIRGRLAAYFASWADGLEMINKRHPSVAHLILNDVTQDRPTHHMSVLVQAKDRLAGVGFPASRWAALAEGERPCRGDVEDGGPGVPRRGWQREAAEKMEDFFLATSVWPRQGHVGVPRRSHGWSVFHVLSNRLPFSFQRSGAPGAPPPSPLPLCPPLRVPAGVAVLTTSLATSHWKAQQPESAVRLVGVSPRTF